MKCRIVFFLLFFLYSVLYLFLSLPDVQNLAQNNPTTTTFIEIRKAQKGKEFHLQWKWIPLEKISPYFIHAVILNEDSTFWNHKGIVWKNIKMAARANWKEKKFLYGASTITQQVAKNLYLSPSKNPFRKIKEWMIAKKMELFLTKERILEIYLNVIELGNGIFGVEAAANYYYDCFARDLSPYQAARLAFCLPSPFKRSPKDNLPYLDFRCNGMILDMYKKKLLTAQQVQESLWMGNCTTKIESYK